MFLFEADLAGNLNPFAQINLFMVQRSRGDNGLLSVLDG